MDGSTTMARDQPSAAAPAPAQPAAPRDAGAPVDPEAPRGRLDLLRVYRPYFVGHRWQMLVLSAAAFIAGICEAALLVVLANIAISIGSTTDEGSVAGALGPLGDFQLSLTAAFLAALGLAIARFVGQMCAAHFTARITEQLTTEARTDTYRDFAFTSWAEQSRYSEADIQDLLIRHVGRMTASIGTLSTGVASICTLTALVLSAIVIDWRAALVLAVSGSALFFLTRPISTMAKRVSRRQQAAGIAYADRSLGAISRSLEVRAFGVTEPVVDELTAATELESKTVYSGILLRQTVVSVHQTVTIFLLLAGLLVVNTALDRPLASLGAIVIILVRALNQMSALQSAYHSLIETSPYLERLTEKRREFREHRPRSGDTEVERFERLRFEAVSYAYGADDRLALDGLDFEVRAGEAVGIIGPSGSGKSTLIQLLLRLREPTAGRYLIDDIDAGEIADPSWFEQIAFVPQDSNLILGTVRANIAFYRDATDDEIVAAAKRAHIHDEIMAMPEGYDTHLGSRGGAVSGGQRQRISIARALLKRPTILVLDEPTSALDMRSERLVHETFTELHGTVTIFAIAHRLSTLNTCDRIMVMGNGELQAFGTRNELEASSSFYRDAVSLSRIRTDELDAPAEPA